jgi:hypothetical protein
MTYASFTTEGVRGVMDWKKGFNVGIGWRRRNSLQQLLVLTMSTPAFSAGEFPPAPAKVAPDPPRASELASEMLLNVLAQ